MSQFPCSFKVHKKHNLFFPKSYLFLQILRLRHNLYQVTIFLSLFSLPSSIDSQKKKSATAKKITPNRHNFASSIELEQNVTHVSSTAQIPSLSSSHVTQETFLSPTFSAGELFLHFVTFAHPLPRWYHLVVVQTIKSYHPPKPAAAPSVAAWHCITSSRRPDGGPATNGRGKQINKFFFCFASSSFFSFRHFITPFTDTFFHKLFVVVFLVIK